MSSRKYDINEAYLQALQEMQLDEARSHKEDNEKVAPRTTTRNGKEVKITDIQKDLDNTFVGKRYAKGAVANNPYYGGQYYGTTDAEYKSKRNKTGQKRTSTIDMSKKYDVYKADTFETPVTDYQFAMDKYKSYEKTGNEDMPIAQSYKKSAQDIVNKERERIANKQNKEEVKEILDEKKKYWPPVYHEYTIDGHTFEFKCQYYEVSGSSQASLWGHDVELRMDGNTISHRVVPYYNRTWETWEFQTAMLGALSQYMDSCKEELFRKQKDELGVRGLKADQKDEILKNNEWYQMLDKLYHQISGGDKGKVEESKKAKTEGQLWGEDRNYDRQMNTTMQEFANQLVTNLTNSGWDYDDSSAKYGTYRFKKGSIEVKYCDNFDKVGIADFEVNNTGILKLLARNLGSDYYDGENYVSVDFRWKKPNVTQIVDILNQAEELKTEDLDDEENEDEDFDPMDETISLFAIAYREVPEVGVEEWGKDDEYLFCLDTKKFLADLEEYEVEIPKSFYNEDYTNDWSNGIDEYLSTYVGIDPDSGEDDNTYNWGSRLTHDLNLHFYDTEDGFYVAIEIHKSGDVRGNYTTRFLLRFDDKDDWYEACFEAQANNKNQVEIDGKHYTIEPDFWSEHCNIWCEEDNNGWDEVYCENIEELKNLIANEEPTY